MELASVRELKRLLTESVLARLTEGVVPHRLTLPAGPLKRAEQPVRTVALGIARGTTSDFRLAVRYQRRELGHSRELDLIERKAKGEVDVRYIGRVAKQSDPPWTQRRHRPLRLGMSVGHYCVTAGTLGAIVRWRSDDAALLLSNNHVLANENRGKPGDAILQPGAYDGGQSPDDEIATLAAMVRLKKAGTNRVDAAVAAPCDGVEVDGRVIKGLGKLAGLGPDLLDEGAAVAKLGRTTGLTRGRVTAFELDNLVVAFDLGNLRFDNQIEMEGSGDEAFSAGGDSGALIVDKNRRAVGLLFAGGDLGGANGMGLTYANPIRAVLDALGLDLVT